MGVKLVAISGPLRGSAVPLTSTDFTIGRDPSSSLCLDDPAVSRNHCVIRKEAQGWRIIDLKSRNGTMVNSERVEAKVLAGGEEIQVGESAFVIAVEVAGEIRTPDAEAQESTRTFILQPQDSVFLNPDALARQTALEQQLAALLRFSAELSGASDIGTLEQKLKECVPEILKCTIFKTRWLDVEGPADEHESRAAKDNAVVLDAGGLIVIPLTFHDVPALLLRVESESFTNFDREHLQAAGAIAAIGSLALDNVRHIERLQGENERLQSEFDFASDMVGESPRVRELFGMIARVAPSDATVLILGESGTGKELVARAIHKHSQREGKPFVAVNCAALTETLLESELFGHEKGAFTGAVVQKRGRIEVAAGGTLFLDEVGELAPALQAKLLRVLQAREFERVGGVRTLQADVRVLAATNKDLQTAVRDGSFRQDLYYRLNVIAIRTPPLRERREDIIPLAAHFAVRFARRAGRQPPSLSPRARASLLQYFWPGNVRELENAIERAVVLGSGEWILPEDLPEEILDASPAASSPSGYHELVREAKRRILVGAIEEAGGSQTAAARLLGLNPTYLSRLIRTLDLKG